METRVDPISLPPACEKRDKIQLGANFFPKPGSRYRTISGLPQQPDWA